MPGAEGRSLLDTEPVLLVDDDDIEGAELGVEQRVGPDRDQRIAVRHTCTARVGCSRRHLAGQEGEVDADPVEQALGRREVLEREHLRRCEECGLSSRLQCTKAGGQGDGRLAGADIALQQPLHRHVAPEIRVDLGDRPTLGQRQLERQVRPVLGAQPAGRRKRAGGRRPVVLRSLCEQRELQQEQLLVGEAAPRSFRLGGVRRPVPGGDGVTSQREPPLQANSDRDRVADTVDSVRDGGLDDALDDLARDPGRGVVDGQETAGIGQIGERRRFGVVGSRDHDVGPRSELEPATELEVAPDDRDRARRQRAQEVPLVEPGDRSPIAPDIDDIGDDQMEPAAPGRAFGDAQDRDEHGDAIADGVVS